LHPTVKPTALVADAIKDVTRHSDLVLDFFLGSGTRLMADERTGRRFRGTWWPKLSYQSSSSSAHSILAKEFNHTCVGFSSQNYLASVGYQT
jgi:DNA modification methylase